ncbi:hypothetical protein K9N68_25495 [Kovacikia minuta CCNUW1]|nr:hypothetical protein [Kovacikia minuta]UBF24970.1 hypothetical protein K9N68_25495 [Kovacikia minuta CCNUW1]
MDQIKNPAPKGGADFSQKTLRTPISEPGIRVLKLSQWQETRFLELL